MKPLLTLLLIHFCSFCFSSNLGFEDGNFTGYNLTYGKNDGKQIKFLWIKYCTNQGVTAETTGISSPNHHAIMDNTVTPDDPLIGSALPTTLEGRYSARLGSRSPLGIPGSKAQTLARTFTVTSGDPHFKFNYAIVTQDPGHGTCSNPYFLFQIIKSNGSVVHQEYILSDSANPYFRSVNGYLYKDWDCVNIDLSRYVNSTLTAKFTTADCSHGNRNHLTYVYIDGINSDHLEAKLSSPQNIYCEDEDVILDGSGSIGEIDHFWSIEETDAMGRRFPSTELSKWFTASQAGVTNISDLYGSLGGQFKCNTYYRIKLAVGNNCVPWKSTEQIIQIECPDVNAGNDLCCSDPSVLKMLGGSLPNSNYTYEWFPKYGLSYPYNSLTPLNCNDADLGEFECFKYTLRATDQYGCVSEDVVRVFFENPKFNIVQSVGCCSNILSIQDDGCYTDILWSTGETSKSISVTTPGNYSVTVSNSCGSTTKSKQVTSLPAQNLLKNLWQPANQGIWYSNGSNVNPDNAFMITHTEDPQPASGFYYATSYKLVIFDRGGIPFHTIEDAVSNCNGFFNNQIRWDGRVNGQQIQSGFYNARLYLKNCFHPDWVPVKVTFCEEYEVECLDLRCEPGLGFKCGFFRIENCYKIGKKCIDPKKHFIFPINIQF